MKRMKNFLGFTFIIVMIFTLSACGESAQSGPATNARDAQAQSQGNGIEPLDLILSHHTSENDSNHVYALAFADAVKELSGGKMKVEVYANGQLFGQADALAALSQGTLDIALSDTALFANYNPAGAIFDMPYLIESREQAIRMVKDKEIIDIIRGIMLNSSHLHVLSIQPLYFRSSLVKNMDIDSIEGFKGLVMRTPEAPHTIAAFRAFGSNPTVVPSGEAYTAVQTGVTDGLEGHPEYVYLQKFYEVAKNYVQTKHVFTFTAYSMSQSVYKGLSDAQRNIIDRAAEKAQDVFLEYTKGLFENSLKKLQEEGVRITEVDLEPFKTATANYLSTFIEKNNLQEMYEKIQQLK